MRAIPSDISAWPVSQPPLQSRAGSSSSSHGPGDEGVGSVGCSGENMGFACRFQRNPGGRSNQAAALLLQLCSVLDFRQPPVLICGPRQTQTLLALGPPPSFRVQGLASVSSPALHKPQWLTAVHARASPRCGRVTPAAYEPPPYRAERSAWLRVARTGRPHLCRARSPGLTHGATCTSHPLQAASQ